MKAFITGGAGFVGASVADFLLSQGHSVTIYDIREASSEPSAKAPKAPIEPLPAMQFIRGDVNDLPALKAAMAHHDAVFHFAANSDIALGAYDTSIDLQMSTIATHNVLEAMRKSDICSITYFSGSGVYGDAHGSEMREDAGPLLPVSLYGAGKLAAEGLISAYSHLFGMDALIFRPANIVGGKQTHGVIFDFVRKLRTNPYQLEVLGDGKQTKSYIHISDVIEAIHLAHNHHGSAWAAQALGEAASVSEHPGVTVYNLASADEVSVDWIAQTVISHMKLSDVEINYTGGASGWPGDVPVIRLSTEKLRSVGWRPQLSSKEAITMAVQEILSDKTEF